MKSDSASADAVYVRGLCLYYKDNLDKGITHFQQVLTLDPDHNKAKVMRIKAKNLKEKKENGNFRGRAIDIFGKYLISSMMIVYGWKSDKISYLPEIPVLLARFQEKKSKFDVCLF